MFSRSHQSYKGGNKKQQYLEGTETSTEYTELIVFRLLHRVQKVRVPQLQTALNHKGM